jgi:hypothetical protein
MPFLLALFLTITIFMGMVELPILLIWVWFFISLFV